MSEEIKGNLDKIIEQQLEAERLEAEKEAAEAAKTVKEEVVDEKKAPEIKDEDEGKKEELVKEVKVEEKPTKTFKEVLAEQQEAERLEAERKEIEALKNDPIIKAAREIRKKNPGMTMREVINYVSDLDVDKIDDKTLFMNSLKGQKMTKDEMEEEYKEFLEQKPYVKDAYLKSEREKLRTVQLERQKELGLTSDGKPEVKDLYNNSIVRLEATLEKIVGSEIDGVTITAERAGQLYKESQKFFSSSLTENGEIDVNEAFETAFAKLYRTIWKKEVQEKAKSEGKVEAFNELHNPNATTMVSSKKEPKQVKYDKEVDEFLEQLNSTQRQSFLSPAQN